MGLKWLMSMQPYGDIWRRGRKLMHAHVHQGVAPQYHVVQVDSARRFAQEILTTKTDKEALSLAVRSNFGRSIIKMVYGITVKPGKSEYISLPETVLENISEGATPGRFLVDFIPLREWSAPWPRTILTLAILSVRHVPAWFPGAGFQRYAEKAQRDHRIMRDKPIEVVQAEMVSC